MNTSEVNRELIKKYLTGQASKQEIAAVRRCLQQPESRQLFDSVWQELHGEMETPAADTISNPNRMEAWKATIRQRIVQEKAHQAEKKERRIVFFRYAAVSIIILGTIFWGLLHINNGQDHDSKWITRNNPPGQRAQIRLADSSIVYLGAGSSLSYPKRFQGKKREIRLEGEAFFEIAKDKHKPFLVHSGDIVTQVLGTSFKIDAFMNSPVVVAVSSGKVRVGEMAGKSMEAIADLTAGQQLTWNKDAGGAVTVMANPEAILAWKAGKLMFDDHPLSEIANILERTYDIDITIQNNALVNKRIRITLEKSFPLKTALDVLSASGGFRYVLDNRTVRIY
ncbi:FecR domain-containing protein [Parapedobacter sp. ISTM3]|uniref:FecR family protein n=1 Tax=Parapedobacter luteus TaxID=623280 RepID=A0A1T5EYV5_9SPHI|nr:MULTISPECIES: FecR domain-containing protein [Parapedobacter]MBK1441499.1 FecR domain-containing protein [Parapedobacter sp. ISTM3]SKB89058.1 FecR family protein [Parapedobacter luteus]